MRRLAAASAFAIALIAGSASADPRDQAAIAEFKRYCVDTHARAADVAAMAQANGWKVSPATGTGPTEWNRTDATGTYRVVAGNQTLEADMTPVRLCGFSIEPPLSGDAQAVLDGWMQGLTPAKANATDEAYFYSERNGTRTSMTLGDKTVGRALIADGSLRGVFIQTSAKTTMLGFVTSESPPN